VDRKTDVRRFREGLYPPMVYAGEEQGETKIRIKTTTCHGRLAGIIQDGRTHAVLPPACYRLPVSMTAGGVGETRSREYLVMR